MDRQFECKPQTNLKKVALHLDNHFESIRWDDFLNHFFGNNQQLKTLTFSTFEKNGFNFTDFKFLEDVENRSVENLELNLNPSQDATEFITEFTNLFPNVKTFTYTVQNQAHNGLYQIRNWTFLESINCKLEDINIFFENINIGEKLTTCNITGFYGDRLSTTQMIKFLNCHQNIKHMILNPSYNTTVSDEIILLIVNNFESLETFICNGKKCSLLEIKT